MLDRHPRTTQLEKKCKNYKFMIFFVIYITIQNKISSENQIIEIMIGNWHLLTGNVNKFFLKPTHLFISEVGKEIKTTILGWWSLVKSWSQNTTRNQIYGLKSVLCCCLVSLLVFRLSMELYLSGWWYVN